MRGKTETYDTLLTTLCAFALDHNARLKYPHVLSTSSILPTYGRGYSRIMSSIKFAPLYTRHTTTYAEQQPLLQLLRFSLLTNRGPRTQRAIHIKHQPNRIKLLQYNPNPSQPSIDLCLTLSYRWLLELMVQRDLLLDLPMQLVMLRSV